MFFTEIERAASDGMTVRGYVAVYDEPTAGPVEFQGRTLSLGGERIARGAFDGLDMSGVYATVNHRNRIEGADVRLFGDDRGLAFEMTLPDTDIGRSVRKGLDNGSLKGMSFTATIGRFLTDAGKVIHQKFAALKEISVVSTPAYAGAIAREAAESSASQLVRARHRVLIEGNDK